MTVRELIRDLYNCPLDYKVYFVVPGEQGRGDTYYPIVDFDIVHYNRKVFLEHREVDPKTRDTE